MNVRKILFLLMTLALLVGTGGCLFSPDEGDNVDTGPTAIPPATTPDILMSNFERIYTEMRIDDFRNMLHPDYKTVLLPSTLQEWEGAGNPLASEYLYRDDEVTIHQNMFSGNTGLDAAGTTVPPIDSISVDYLQKVNAWEPVPESDTVFGGYGAYYALYNVLIYFNNPDQHRFEVRQDVEFYVVGIEDGGRTIWQLLGQRGHEPAK